LPIYIPLNSQRSDGYGDGINVFQDVRAYDPNMNQWTSPGAYAGDVHDPMSQKPYMWNGNNPVAHSDPSGYVWEIADRHIDDRLKQMAKDSPTFRKMYDEIANMKAVVKVIADYGSSDNKYHADIKDGGGTISLGMQGNSRGEVTSDIAHETAHAYHNAIGTNSRDTGSTVPGYGGLEPANQEEVNAYNTEHQVDKELGNQGSWSGPPWGSQIGHRELSWSTFSANYTPSQFP
jgi:hypothetical protein